MFVARPENGLLAFALTPFLRRHSDHELPSRPGSAPHPSIRRIAMLGLHHLSRKAVRLGIAAGSLVAAAACGDNTIGGPTLDATLSRIAGFDQLKAALVKARNEHNGGFNLDMWAAVVDRNGLVVAVVFTGATSTDQWPGSRVIAAQKANTANAFSLPHLALSTANLYAATQPGGTLFGLQEANPTNDDVAYGGDAADHRPPQGLMGGEGTGGAHRFGGGRPPSDGHRAASAARAGGVKGPPVAGPPAGTRSMAARLRSTSSSVVPHDDPLMRMAVRPCHTVPPAQHVPSACTPAITRRVSSASPNDTST